MEDGRCSKDNQTRQDLPQRAAVSHCLPDRKRNKEEKEKRDEGGSKYKKPWPVGPFSPKWKDRGSIFVHFPRAD